MAVKSNVDRILEKNLKTLGLSESLQFGTLAQYGHTRFRRKCGGSSILKTDSTVRSAFFYSTLREFLHFFGNEAKGAVSL